MENTNNDIDKIYFRLLQDREDEYHRVADELNLEADQRHYMDPTESQKTRFMVKAAAIYLSGKLK